MFTASVIMISMEKLETTILEKMMELKWKWFSHNYISMKLIVRLLYETTFLFLRFVFLLCVAHVSTAKLRH